MDQESKIHDDYSSIKNKNYGITYVKKQVNFIINIESKEDFEKYEKILYKNFSKL